LSASVIYAESRYKELRAFSPKKTKIVRNRIIFSGRSQLDGGER
jgi:hypothetical protein